ncbi:MAG: VCBS repeat-containing protein [Planctomycetota bacterium]|nr:MAG: VCBS repeat-containing protein [Planctomycetota bacterium]
MGPTPAAHDQARVQLQSSWHSRQSSASELRMEVRRTAAGGEPPATVLHSSRSPASDRYEAQTHPAEDDGLSQQQRSTLLILERLFGMKARITVPRLAQPSSPEPTQTATPHQTPATLSWHWDAVLSYEQEEYLSFDASVELTNGLRASLSFSYSYAERLELRLSSMVAEEAVDPLALNLGLGGLQVHSRDGLRIDLNGDGNLEQLPDLGPGGVWLAYDGNGNGRVDGGHELFGPASGNGFADLAALDDDGNGWIDEGDAAFANLRLWHRDGSLSTLGAHGIQAISLSWVDTPWRLRDEAGDTAALLQRSGVYLRSDGRLGAAQQVDVLV